jgi:hypothetical protein
VWLFAGSIGRGFECAAGFSDLLYLVEIGQGWSLVGVAVVRFGIRVYHSRAREKWQRIILNCREDKYIASNDSCDSVYKADGCSQPPSSLSAQLYPMLSPSNIAKPPHDSH